MLTPLARALILAGIGLAALAGGTDARGQSFGLLRLRVGVVDLARFRTTAERLEPFRAYLADKLQTPVQVIVFRNGQELVDATAHNKIDYGVYTAATYAATWHICGCIEPVAAPKSIDGTAGVKSVLVVRGDSAFRSPQELTGKILAASDPRSVAGRLVPFMELASEGSDPATLFARIDTVQGPDAAVLRVLDHKADAAFAWSTLEGEEGEGFDRGTLHDLVARHLLDMHAIRIIWRSGLIPNGPHAVRSDLPLDTKNRLRDLLIDLADASPAAYEAVEPVFGGGFVPIGHSTYLPMLRLVTPAGRDPMQPPVPGASATAPKG